jgi:hypothetical protein
MFHPDAQAIHFGGGSSSNAPIQFYLELQKADLHYWRKHHGRVGRQCYAVLILLRHIVRIPWYVAQYGCMPKRRAVALFKLKRAWATVHWVLRGDRATETTP